MIIGPGFNNVDMSLVKHTKINERFSSELRFEAFDLLNHAEFWPARTCGTSWKHHLRRNQLNPFPNRRFWLGTPIAIRRKAYLLDARHVWLFQRTGFGRCVFLFQSCRFAPNRFERESWLPRQCSWGSGLRRVGGRSDSQSVASLQTAFASSIVVAASMLLVQRTAAAWTAAVLVER